MADERFLPTPREGYAQAAPTTGCTFFPVPVDEPRAPLAPDEAVRRICEDMGISPSEPMSRERHDEFADRFCGLTTGGWCRKAHMFGPFAPILPVPVTEPPPGTPRPEPRRWDYPVGWDTADA